MAEGDKVYVFVHAATKAGEPMVVGPFDKVVDVEYDTPWMHVILQVPAAAWDEDHPQWKGPRHA